MTNNGGYDDGYKYCPCFWGNSPSSLVQMLIKFKTDFNGAKILDLGCGEGKNAKYFASLGATVIAIDISSFAIKNAIASSPQFHTINWIHANVLDVDYLPTSFDVILMYGLLHCLPIQTDIIHLVSNVKRWVKPAGFVALANFNDRYQELNAHPGFNPLLLPHKFYSELFDGWDIKCCTDTDLTESHPHNNILHTHSMTRILAKKGSI